MADFCPKHNIYIYKLLDEFQVTATRFWHPKQSYFANYLIRPGQFIL